jgi:hypothetical protein
MSRADKAHVFRDAHRLLCDSRRLDMPLTFADCLRRAWAAERQRQAFERQQ